MEFQEHLNNFKEIQNEILDFISEDNYSSEDFKNLTNLIKSKNILDNRHGVRLILHLLLKISKNHKHTNCFFVKIDRILEFLKDKILHFLTNVDIFNMCHENRRFLLQLIQQEILTMNQTFAVFLSKNIMNVYYFYPEMMPFLRENKINVNAKDLNTIRKNVHYYQKTNNFFKLRYEGENNNYICSLIRNDSVVEFITYVNRTNYSLSSKITGSIFESNSFLIGKQPTLIEYSAFFGSIQIFQYLKMNSVELTPSLWIYAIHGQNPELIHLLEENGVVPENNDYRKCYLECILCHHNNFANYIKENYLEDNDQDKNKKKSLFNSFVNFIRENIFHNNTEYDKYMVFNKFESYNFSLIDEDDLIGTNAFFGMVLYDHYELVKLLINNKDIDINVSIIFTKLYLNRISHSTNCYIVQNE